jgi:hypothetical protein
MAAAITATQMGSVIASYPVTLFLPTDQAFVTGYDLLRWLVLVGILAHRWLGTWHSGD